MKKDSRLAFTMAEIILAMTVIGVLAVITLPSLTSNIDDRNYAARRVALYSRLSQAVGVIDSLSDAGRYNADGSVVPVGDVENNAAVAFILNKLSQGMKIENVCNSSDIKNCGISLENNFYSKRGGNKFTLPEKFSGINNQFKLDNSHSTKVAAFTTRNGDSIAIYYNPDCLSSPNGSYSGIFTNAGGEDYKKFSYKDMVCANFIYDTNGLRSPNTVGKDVGIGTILFANGSEVYLPVNVDYLTFSKTHAQAMSGCVGDNKILPSRNELISIALNKNYLFATPPNSYYWSSTNVITASGVTEAWLVRAADDTVDLVQYPKNKTANYICAEPLSSMK